MEPVSLLLTAGSLLRKAWSFLRTYWPALLVVALVATIVMLRLQNGFLERDLATAKAATKAEQDAHKLTVANYRAAAAQAKQRDAENVLRVKNEQVAINERNVNAFEARLADGNARYERLRTQAAAYSRSAGTPDVSAAREATCHAYANTGCDRLPGLLKAAQDNTDQLLSLIDWANDQGKVSPGDEHPDE